MQANEACHTLASFILHSSLFQEFQGAPPGRISPGEEHCEGKGTSSGMCKYGRGQRRGRERETVSST